MYELHQVDVLKAIDEHRRDELTRSWAHHRGLLASVFGGRRLR